jgi:hypothetical protein
MFIINAMRSCSERTILHCVESYLYYITLVNKKKNSEEWNREKINRQYTYIVENIKFIYTSDWNSFGINIGGWAGVYNIQRTNFCRITTCNERRINRVYLSFSLYTNCQNRPYEKEFNTTAFVNLHIYNVYANIILWRNLNIVSTKLFPQSDLLRYQRV